MKDIQGHLGSLPSFLLRFVLFVLMLITLINAMILNDSTLIFVVQSLLC